MYTWGQLAGGICLPWVCLHCVNRYYCFGVVGLCTLAVDWGFHLPWVCLHLSIGNTVLV